MKTNTIFLPVVQFQTVTVTSPASRLRDAPRLLLALLCIFWVSVFASTNALAGGPDGEYKFVSATGFVSFGGETREIRQEVVKEVAVIQNGKIVIKDNRLQINRKAAARIIKQIGDELRIGFETNITGPTYLKLHKTGKAYVGNSSRPVVVTFKGMVNDTKFWGRVDAGFMARAKGKTLELTIPISGSVLGHKLDILMTVVGKR